MTAPMVPQRVLFPELICKPVVAAFALEQGAPTAVRCCSRRPRECTPRPGVRSKTGRQERAPERFGTRWRI